jgi:hypothetical protein
MLNSELVEFCILTKFADIKEFTVAIKPSEQYIHKTAMVVKVHAYQQLAALFDTFVHLIPGSAYAALLSTTYNENPYVLVRRLDEIKSDCPYEILRNLSEITIKEVRRIDL